ncbi:amino acid ABC transporter permease [Aquamicrobium terrae]
MTYNFDFGPVWQSMDQLLWGACLTVKLTSISCLFGFLIAILCVFVRMRSGRIGTTLVSFYVEIIRNTPLLVQLFFIFFGLPSLGIRLDPTYAALVAMTANVGAYAAEILRAGVESIPRGQSEAGFALGLSEVQIFRKIVLPPAVRAVYPALSSQFIMLLLGSSVVSAISANDLTAVANTIQSQNLRSFEVYFTVIGLYLAMSILFRLAFGAIYSSIYERKGHW